MISFKDLVKGRDLVYAQFWTPSIACNLKILEGSINGFLDDLGYSWTTAVSSGWRPPPINKKAGGAPRSAHLLGLAVDIYDFAEKPLTKAILKRDDLLKKWGLWMEDPRHTSTWVHLDLVDRGKREKNIFIP